MELKDPDSMAARVAGWIQDITYALYLQKKNECGNEMHFAKWNERWKMKMNNDSWKWK